MSSSTRSRAVSYHRVSTLDQDPTLGRQQLELAARARGLDLVEQIEETGSGARNDRPGLRRVLELARAGQVSHVLVWKLDRLGRSAIDVLHNVQQLERAGVTFVATSQGLEMGPGTGALGQMILQVMAAMAQFERALISERTQLAMQTARARGRKLGRPRGARDVKQRVRRWKRRPQ